MTLDIYTVLAGADNQLTITSYNAASGEIAGHFQITFVFDRARDPDKTVASIPDTVYFTNGRFRTKIIERE